MIETLPASARFFDFLYALFDRDIYHVAPRRRRDAALALAQSVARLHGDLEAPLHVMAMSQQVMIAAALGEPLYYRRFEGLEQQAPAPLYQGERTRAVRTPHFRAVAVAGTERAEAPWLELKPGHLLYVDEQWEAHAINLGSVLQLP